MPSTTRAYEGGLHADSAAGPIDVGLAVTPDALGVRIDAPLIGQLSAAFAVLPDGSTRLTSIRRRTAQGLDSPVLGLTDEPRLAMLSGELDDREAELEALRESMRSAEATFAGQRHQAATRLAQTEAELSTTRATLATTQATQARLERELETEKALLLTERQAHNTQSNALRAELTETRRKLTLSEETRHADADRAAEAESALQNELGQARALAAATGEQLKAAVAESAAASQRARDELARVEAGARAVSDALTSMQARAAGLDQDLAQARAASAEQLRELEKERADREELVRDVAYIQSQVADLASTKGELVSRVSQMNKRESQRQKTTAEFSDVLRTAEVVAADVKATARRQEGRALRLEEQVKGLLAQVAALEGRLDVADQNERDLKIVTEERNALKIDVAFFQKQIGALQRAKQPPRPGGKPPPDDGKDH